jgi:hypothetical protein
VIARIRALDAAGQALRQIAAATGCRRSASGEILPPRPYPVRPRALDSYAASPDDPGRLMPSPAKNCSRPAPARRSPRPGRRSRPGRQALAAAQPTTPRPHWHGRWTGPLRPRRRRSLCPRPRSPRRIRRHHPRSRRAARPPRLTTPGAPRPWPPSATSSARPRYATPARSHPCATKSKPTLALHDPSPYVGSPGDCHAISRSVAVLYRLMLRQS